MTYTYEHINDCWNAIRDYDKEGRTYDELLELLETFPRWSGNWEVYPNEYNECLVVNSYWNKQYQNYEEDQEDTTIAWPFEREEE